MNYAQDLFPEEQRKDPADINVERGEEIMGIFVDIHASGGYVYFPWGFEDSRSPDDEALQALGRKVSHFNDYKLWVSLLSHMKYFDSEYFMIQRSTCIHVAFSHSAPGY